jgi:hypothetical protein
LNTWDNVVTSCSTCNNRKGGRLPSEAGLALRHEPTEPNYVHLVWVVRRVTDAQAKYIKMFYGEDALEAVSSRPTRGRRGAMEPLSPAEAAELAS